MCNQIKWILAVTLFLTAMIVPGCNRWGSEKPITGINSPLQAGNVQVTTVKAQILNSYSVHYIMQYPQDIEGVYHNNSFYVVQTRNQIV